MNAKEAHKASWEGAYNKVRAAIIAATTDGHLSATINTIELGCWVSDVIKELKKQGYTVEHDTSQPEIDKILAKYPKITPAQLNKEIDQKGIEIRDRLLIGF